MLNLVKLPGRARGSSNVTTAYSGCVEPNRIVPRKLSPAGLSGSAVVLWCCGAVVLW